jgi:hypothetical protein
MRLERWRTTALLRLDAAHGLSTSLLCRFKQHVVMHSSLIAGALLPHLAAAAAAVIAMAHHPVAVGTFVLLERVPAGYCIVEVST